MVSAIKNGQKTMGFYHCGNMCIGMDSFHRNLISVRTISKKLLDENKTYFPQLCEQKFKIMKYCLCVGETLNPSLLKTWDRIEVFVCQKTESVLGVLLRKVHRVHAISLTELINNYRLITSEACHKMSD